MENFNEKLQAFFDFINQNKVLTVSLAALGVVGFALYVLLKIVALLSLGQ